MAFFPLKPRALYLIYALLLFCIEVVIALFVRDAIIRPHFGDVLVVMLIYCLLRTVFNWPVRVTAVITLVFSYVIEILQYFKIVEILGLQNSTLAKVVIGTYFSWIDMMAYTAGIVIVLVIEKLRAGRKEKTFVPGKK